MAIIRKQVFVASRHAANSSGRTTAGGGMKREVNVSAERRFTGNWSPTLPEGVIGTVGENMSGELETL